ncbi:MAG: hypothetical protein EU530_02250 [Promethearchaeota archaeon]|nr:MAG: hypothetical protein EU530_02250 [Candidatus Lokiarchaeota archaeon]
MECIFRGLDTKTCFSHQKCVGIQNLCQQMGSSDEFALGFARYAFRTSIFNKLKDNMYETQYKFTLDPNSVFMKIKYLIYSLADKIGSKILGNPYSVQEKYTKIENRVFKMEFHPKRYSPMEYCNQAGKGYGFFFYWAAIGSGKTKEFSKTMADYGAKIGAIVTMRDMVKDYQSDRRLGKYNPFHHMKFTDIEPYFQENIRILQEEIKTLQNSVSNTILQKIPKQNAFNAIFRYTMQSENFCAKCTRETMINQLNAPATKTAVGVLTSLMIFLGLNNVCGTVAATGGSTIASILQETTDPTCCQRCCIRCCGDTLEGCCDRCSTVCDENCQCGSDECCQDCSCDCSPNCSC